MSNNYNSKTKMKRTKLIKLKLKDNLIYLKCNLTFILID